MVSLATVPTSFAQTRFQQVIEIQVAPVHQQAFENFAMKVKEAAGEIESPMSWTMVQVTVGKPEATYRVVLGFDAWAERDQWGTVQSVLTEAFGEQEAAQILRAGRGGIVSETSRIWELLEDSSSHLRVGSQPANFYTVAIRHVRPEMVPEFREIQRGFKAAFEPVSDGPSFARWILRVGEGSGTTFRRTQPFDTWAERGTGRGGQILIEHQGEEGRRLNLETLRRAVEKMDIFVSAHRPDLSRLAASPTSD